MTDASANPATLQMHLADLYRQSSVLNRQMVQLFAVIYGPVSRTSVVDCFNRAGLRTKTQKPFLPATAKTYIEALLAAGLLVQDRGKGPQCNPLLAEIATRDAVRSGLFEKWVAAVETCLPIRSSWKDGPRRFNNESEFIREVRIGLYRKDMKFIEKQFEDYSRFNYHTDKITLDDIYWRVCNNPFDGDWFATLPPTVASTALKSILDRGARYLVPTDEALKYLQEVCTQSKPNAQSDGLQALLTEQLILRGRIEKAQQSLALCSDRTLPLPVALSGWLAFLYGNGEAAIAHYETALQLLRKGAGKRTLYFSSISGLFFILALIKEGSAARLREAGAYLVPIAKQSHHPFARIYAFLASVIKVQQGQLAAKTSVLNASIPHHDAGNSIETLFCSLCLYWISQDNATSRLPKLLESYYRQAEKSGYRWLAMEAAELLSRLKARTSFGTQAEVFRQVNNNITSLADTIQPQEAWELCLNALTNLQKAAPAETKPEAELRLVWFVSLQGNDCQLSPREQKITAKGDWSRGRAISLKRLHENLESFEYFTSQDRRICQQLQNYYSEYRYYGQVEYNFSDRAIAALVGHPLVFWEDSPTTRVEVVKGEPELLVQTSKKDWLTLQFSPPILGENEVLVVKETPTRLKVIEITNDHRRIAEILGVKNCLEVPAAAKDRVLTAINAVSGVVTVQSDIGGGGENAQAVPADATPHVHLLPAGPGLKVAVMARPFAQGGPYFRPGTGGKTVLAEIEGERLQTTRDLEAEKQQSNAVTTRCSVLDLYPEMDGEWLVEDPEHCLELLLDLQTLGDQVVIEWPEGETLRVAHQAGLKNFRLNINRQKDWFAASG
ncbi:MAG: ATP-dependent helicase, partial [Thermosynechococcaceae cyanobacterium]